jgi:hypothetical protein
MFRHVVMLRYRPDASHEQRSAVVDALATLPDRIPEIGSYAIGADAGVNDGNFDLVIVADFDDLAGYLVYRDHADHEAVMREHIAPILAERAAVQHRL